MGAQEARYRPDHPRMTVATPRPATTVCVLREVAGGVEVLMVQRSASATFMGGAWVFPGGGVEAQDASTNAARVVRGVGAGELPWVAAGLRELVEEVGLWITEEPFVRRVEPGGRGVYRDAEQTGVVLEGGSAVLFSHWVTPPEVPVRFDTRFYAVLAPRGLDPVPDRAEVAAAAWMCPRRVLRAAQRGEMLVAFPTVRTLEVLAEPAPPADLLRHLASAGAVEPVLPRMWIAESGTVAFVAPVRHWFDELPAVVGDEESARSLTRPVPEAPG